MTFWALRGFFTAFCLAGAFWWHDPLVPAIAAAPSCEIDNVDRIVAIGDVHGAYDRFVEILQTAGLIDAKQHWAGGTTHFIQTGDVVDRGPDSRKALDLGRQLEREAAAAGGAAHMLLGNHEVARMLGDLRYTTPGEYEAFMTSRSEEVRQEFVQQAPIEKREKLLADTPLGLVEMRMAFGRAGDYGKWLRTHDTVLKVNGVLFMHGGISPAVASMSCGTINDTVRRELTSDIDKTRADPLKSLAAREDGPLWYRGMIQQDEAGLDDTLTKQKARSAVIAHTVTRTSRIQVRFGGKVIEIDTGMQPAYVQGGRASALEIRHGVFTAIYQDGREILIGSPTEGKDLAPVAVRPQ
jgi:hypothetical protein